jgi:Mg2+-importing ATPase
MTRNAISDAAPPSLVDRSLDALLAELGTSPTGLTSDEALSRLSARGAAPATANVWLSAAALLASQFRSPITLLLVAAAFLSLVLHSVTDAAIILIIVVISAMLGFTQEFSAAGALAALLAVVKARATVMRDGNEREVPADQVVPGDIAVLSAGSSIPGDCRLIETHDLFVNDAALTGESFPVEKQATAPGQNSVILQGSYVVSGTGRALVVLVGNKTQLGRIGQRLRLRPPETDFERGVRRFGAFLLELTMLLTMGIVVVHLATGRPAMAVLLFALALAVGLTPQLLPAIISVNLAQGARQLAARKVIVRRLASIENFGSMNILCSDKTGTLTEGTAHVERCVDFTGTPHERALYLAAVNATLETGFTNPIDQALRSAVRVDQASVGKLDEIPYDFLRKRLTVLAHMDGQRILISKGALANVLEICIDAEDAAGRRAAIDDARPLIEQRFDELGRSGFRVIGVAYRTFASDRARHEDESAMTFAGLIALHDPPRDGAAATIERMHQLGVTLKIVTGDNRVVAASVAAQVGLEGAILTGDELPTLTDEALMSRARDASVFAEIEPNQKERIVLALRRGGAVVGYLGDGINDATALHAADVGISVDGAVDVAKQAADIVLMERGLDVLVEGVTQGRATFANTMKYVLLATSANFGNMFSMAGVSLFLPFLPLLPKQILLTNLLTDLPEMTIARDRVDDVLVERPQRWNIGMIRRFMIVFGLLSSVFDYATFGVLLLLLHAGVSEFRTGWFVESVVSACTVVLIVRSRQPLWTSRPAPLLVATTALVVIVAIALPYLPLGNLLGFTPLPPTFLLTMLLLVVCYAASAEALKRWFFAGADASRSK